MKFGKLVKRLYISIILLMSVVSVLPLLFIGLDVGVNEYESSGLHRLISALDE